MNPALHHSRPIKDRETAGVDSQHPDVPYFPNGGVAAPPFMIVSPLSHSPGTAPGNGSANELVGPATAEWVKIRSSDSQGVGVPPFKRWPRQFHTEAYNFDSLAIMPLPDQVGPIPAGVGNQLAAVNSVGQRSEKAGWSTPKYGEQYEQPIGQYGLASLMQTNDPASQAFAIGWGFVG
ncbi:MAG TPA: hypothetical protein VFI54_06330 [Solirubrobacteraceae bacterium]|nr:hypothetical protein [Solirubrobacteraceae bacterium]